ncbi:hypothetical protein EMPG_10836 [Blastomyces silverae]|uniref:DUF7730 domain-containing protein n=1 Tax=Blastomyces silverae TaxID=2060906 RepID=A0A0H1B2N1_9EURO|nr:hypothetical protein EMPG_10836 [Blastomyces silverae]
MSFLQRVAIRPSVRSMLNFIETLRGFVTKTPPVPTPTRKTIQESYFLTRLPPEIRVQIYKLIFARDTIHLLHNKGRISHIRIPLRSRTRRNEYDYFYFQCSVDRSQISSLLLTCRQIHKEAAPLFYSTPVFRVSLQETWNLFAKLIGPENLSHVRSLRAPVHLQLAQGCSGPPASTISSRGSQPKAVVGPMLWASSVAASSSYNKDEERNGYDEFCDILATKMYGLRDLMLVLVSLPDGPVRSLDAEWHRPLRRLRGLREFSLEIRNESDAEAEDTKALVRFLRETVCARREEGVVHVYVGREGGESA